MKITFASKSDIELITQHTGQALTEGTLGHYSVENKKANLLMEKILKNNGKLLVAKTKNELAGWILFGSEKDRFSDEEIGFIYEIYIFGNFRKNGYARVLMEEAMQILKHQGLKDVRLVVYKGNKAINLYEQLGFEENRIVMTKKL